MRIRRRSKPLSSPPLAWSPAAVFPDLSAHAHPAQGKHGGRDSDTGRGAPPQGLHSDEGDLKKDRRTLSGKPTGAPYPPPCGPHLTLDGSKADPTVSAPHQYMIHLKLGLVQVLRRNAEEEDGTKRWRNSNLRPSSSTALAVSAEEQHGGSGLSQKKEKKGWNESAEARNSSCSVNGNDDNGRCKCGTAAANSNGKIKRRRRPAVLMEGSRCSRVNGRGWRCCQQTLVGYSLCEHHLGKGRMRSVTGQLGTTTTTTTASTHKTRSISGASATSKSQYDEEILDREQLQPWPLHYCFRAAEVAAEEKSTTTATSVKRKKKLGVGKARTISSLLDESNAPLTTAASTAHAMRQ